MERLKLHGPRPVKEMNDAESTASSPLSSRPSSSRSNEVSVLTHGGPSEDVTTGKQSATDATWTPANTVAVQHKMQKVGISDSDLRRNESREPIALSMGAPKPVDDLEMPDQVRPLFTLPYYSLMLTLPG